MKKYLFHHLPKTAGSSLIVQCRKFFDSTCDNSRYDPELTKEKIISKSFTFYHGHYSFDKVREFKNLNSESLIFTFLRNPLNRVISHYYNKIDMSKVIPEIERVKNRGYIKNLQEKESSYFNEIAQLSLEEYLISSSKIAKESRFNRMVRYLGPQKLFINNRELAIEQCKDNLFNFYSVFGLTEMMDISLRSIEEKLNIPSGYLDEKFKTNLNNKKKSSKKYSVSMATFKKLIELNLYDIEIYTFCFNHLNQKSNSENKILSPIKILIDTGPKIIDTENQSERDLEIELMKFYLELKLIESKKYLRKHINQFIPSDKISDNKNIINDLRKNDQFTKKLFKRRNYFLQNSAKWINQN